jgi:hypothetical protein
VLDLLELLVAAQGEPVRQVHFQVNLLPTYDTATPQQIQESVQSFLSGTAPIPPHKLGHLVSAARSHRQARSSGLGLTPTPGYLIAQAREQAPRLPFALEYPRAADTYNPTASTLRRYAIRDQQGRLHPIYAIVVNRGPLGEYYDVQGTDWTNPPLLSNPSQTVRVGSRTYGLFYSGEQIRAISWRDGNAVYWIQNTLTNSVPPDKMLAMAEESLPVAGTVAGAPTAPPSPRSVRLPPRVVSAPSAGSQLGAALGLAGVAVVALLGVGVLARQRTLRHLRQQVAQALVLEARQRPLLAGAPAVVDSGAGGPTRGATIYRAPRSRRRALLAGVAVLLAGVAAALAVHFAAGSPRSSTPPRRSTVPVAVFNATSSGEAAQLITGALRAHRVHVAETGNINASLGPGVYVFYPPGAYRQARALARVIPSLAPTITPIQPQVQNAVGRHDEIVILLD